MSQPLCVRRVPTSLYVRFEVWLSHPHMYGENVGVRPVLQPRQEPSPHVRGKHFLTRLNNQSSRETDSLCVFPLRGLGLTFYQTVTLKLVT